MIKLFLLAFVVTVVLLFLLRRFPALATRFRSLLGHPIIKSVLIQRCLRILRFLIFRR